METITQEMIDEGWENFSNKIEETFEKAKLKKETKMENHRLSLIEVNGFLLSGTPKQTLLALDGKEIPGQIGIRQIVSDRRGFKVVTVAFDVPDEESIEKKAENEFNEIKERVYTLYNRVIYGALRGSEEVAKEMGGLTVGYSEYGINRISLMTDIANFAFNKHPRILWGITETDIGSTGDPTLEFRGVEEDKNAHCPICGALKGEPHKPFCSVGIGAYCG